MTPPRRVSSLSEWSVITDSAWDAPIQLEQRFRRVLEVMRLLYFAALFATATWLIVLIWRKFVAVRQVNVIVESPERTAQVNALERALRAEGVDPDSGADEDQEPS